MSIYTRQGGLVRPEFMLGHEIIALMDSLARIPWHVRVTFDVEDTNVLIHTRQRNGLRAL